MNAIEYDAALQREAEAWPGRADEIAAERARIAPEVDEERRNKIRPDAVALVEARILEILAEADDADGADATIEVK